MLYGSETWTIKARDTRRITAAEMKYMRRTAGYAWTDYKTNTLFSCNIPIVLDIYKGAGVVQSNTTNTGRDYTV